jgi:outer membrane protein TolC
MKQKSEEAVLNLGQLLNDNQILKKNLQPFLPEITHDIYSDKELSNPLLTKAKIETMIGSKKLSLAKSAYYPNFNFGFDYRIRKDMPMDAVRGEDFITFKAGLQIPLWFFAKQKNETKSARFDLKAAEEKLNLIQNHLEKQIGVTKVELNRLAESCVQYNNFIKPQAEATFEATRVAYEVGDVDFNAFLAAQLDLFTIDLEQLELKKNYWQKSAELAELNGEK